MRLFIYSAALVIFAVFGQSRYKKKAEKSKYCRMYWDYTQIMVKFLWMRARLETGFPSKRKRLLGFSCNATDRAYKAHLTEKKTVYNPKNEELIVIYERCEKSMPKFERAARREVDLNLQNMPWLYSDPISVGCVNIKKEDGCRRSVCSATNKEFVLPQKVHKALLNG